MRSWEPWGLTKPSFTLTAPWDSVLPRVDMRGTSKGCGTPETRSVAARGMRCIRLTDLGNLPGVSAPLGHILEPVLERKSSFSEVVFAKGVLIPGDELDGGELIGYREINIEIEGGVLLRIGGVQRLFDNTCLVSNGQTRDDKEAGWDY